MRSIRHRRPGFAVAVGLAFSVGAIAASAAFPRLAAAPAVPSDPPPRLADHAGAPPPAWIATGSSERWLGPSSFNWDGVYINILYHAYLPSFTLRKGQTVTFHLAFEPTSSLRLELGPSTYRLANRQDATWRVPTKGRIASNRTWRKVRLHAVGARGDAFYVARFRIRP